MSATRGSESEMPLVSVVMPVYNAAELLAESIESLVAQTFDDFELVCINDGSSDGSARILDQYASRYPFIRVFHQENIGQYRTRNIAFNYVRGRYLLSVDCDDVASPSLIETVVYRAEAEQADITMLGWAYLVPGRRGPDVYRWHLRDWERQAPTTKFPMGYGYLWMKLYRMEFLRRNQLAFREDYYSKADVIFHWKTMSLAERVSVVPEVLYYYRVHENSVTGTIGRRFIQSIYVMEAIKEELIRLDDPRGLLPAWYSFALTFIQAAYYQLEPEYRPAMEDELRAFMSRMSADEKRYYREPGVVGRTTCYFYLSLESFRGKARYRWWFNVRRNLAWRTREWIMPRPLRDRLLRVVRSHSYTLSRSAVPDLRKSVDELNRTVDALARDNYELRAQLGSDDRMQPKR